MKVLAAVIENGRTFVADRAIAWTMVSLLRK